MAGITSKVDHLFDNGFSVHERGTFRVFVPNSLFADRDISIPTNSICPEPPLTQLFIQVVKEVNGNSYPGCDPTAVLDTFGLHKGTLKGKQFYLLAPKELVGSAALESKIKEMDSLKEKDLDPCLRIATKIYTLDADLPVEFRESVKSLLPTQAAIFRAAQQPSHLKSITANFETVKKRYEETPDKKLEAPFQRLETELKSLHARSKTQLGTKEFSASLQEYTKKLTEFDTLAQPQSSHLTSLTNYFEATKKLWNESTSQELRPRILDLEKTLTTLHAKSSTELGTNGFSISLKIYEDGLLRLNKDLMSVTLTEETSDGGFESGGMPKRTSKDTDSDSGEYVMV